MATTLLERLFSGRDAVMNENERRYKEIYLIRSDSNSEDPRTVWNTEGLPKGGNSYGTDLNAVCRELAVRPYVDGDWQYWVATATFSTRPYDAVQRPGAPNARGGFNEGLPQEELPIYRSSGTLREVPAVADLYGKPYRNSAGQPLKGATKEVCTFVLEIDRNVAYTNPTQQYTYLNNGGAVNSDIVFNDTDIGLWKVAGWDSIRNWRGGSPFYKEKLVLHYRSEGWRRYILDEGYAHQKSSEVIDNTSSTLRVVGRGDFPVITKPQAPTDVYGTTLGNPVLLDGRGNALKDITTTMTFLDVTDTSTTIFVDSTTKFPTVGGLAAYNLGTVRHVDTEGSQAGLYIRIGLECMQVLEKTDTTFFVLRGARGTQATAHSIGDTVYMAEVYLEFRQNPELPFGVLGINWSIAGGT